MTAENNIHSYQANVAIKVAEASAVSDDGILLEEVSIGAKIADLHGTTDVIAYAEPVMISKEQRDLRSSDAMPYSYQPPIISLASHPSISSIRYDSSQRAKRRKINQLKKRIAVAKGAKKHLFKEMLKVLKRRLYKFNNGSLSGAFYGGRGSKTKFKANHKRERDFVLYGIPFPARQAPMLFVFSAQAGKTTIGEKACKGCAVCTKNTDSTSDERFALDV